MGIVSNLVTRIVYAKQIKELSEYIDEWFCESREIPCTPERYKARLPEVVGHIAAHYEGFDAYNMWYVWHHAHDLGILKKGLPAKGCVSTNVESERQKELLELGGVEALNAYLKVVEKDM